MIFVGDNVSEKVKEVARRLPAIPDKDVIIHIPLDRMNDPLDLKRQAALKILLNAHSTGVMSRMGRVVGNTMTNVKPSNLKLIGRATYLILSHVNDTILQEEWIERNGKTEPVTYAMANAILFETMDFVTREGGQNSEVELSIVRILEALRKNSFISWNEALSVAETIGLENYLERHNS